MQMPIIMSLLTCCLLLSACGKKGPLYLPEEQTNKQALHTDSKALRLPTLQEKS